MLHGVTYGTRLRIGLAQFIHDVPRHAVSEVPAGLSNWLGAGLRRDSGRSRTEREHLKAGIAVINICPIALLSDQPGRIDVGAGLAGRTQIPPD